MLTNLLRIIIMNSGISGINGINKKSNFKGEFYRVLKKSILK